MVLKFVLNKACPIICKVAICTEFRQFREKGLLECNAFLTLNYTVHMQIDAQKVMFGLLSQIVIG